MELSFTVFRFPWWLRQYRICLQCGTPGFDPWVGKIHWRRDRLPTPVFLGFPCGSDDKESTCNTGDLGLIPGLGRSGGEGKGYPLQYSGLENSMDCIVHGIAKSWTRLSNFHFHFTNKVLIYSVTFAAAAAAAKSLQSCLTLCDPTDGSPPGSPIPGILKARTLEWVAISFSDA